jgi:hypothetical protein
MVLISSSLPVRMAKYISRVLEFPLMVDPMYLLGSRRGVSYHHLSAGLDGYLSAQNEKLTRRFFRGAKEGGCVPIQHPIPRGREEVAYGFAGSCST